MVKAIQVMGWGEKPWDEGKANSDSVIAAAQIGNRVTMNPSSAITEFKGLNKKMPLIIKMIDDQFTQDRKIYKTVELLKGSL